MSDLILLVVDDDPVVSHLLRAGLPATWRLMVTHNPSELPERGFHAALVDMHFAPQLDQAQGVDVIRQLAQKHPHLEIIAMSGNLDRKLMEQCLKAGASRFLAKPLHMDEVELTLSKIESLFLMQGATARAVTGATTWVGNGPASQRVRREIALLTSETGPILIEGESGTGKEVTAHLLHAQTQGAPLVVINVAGVPENLFESEFFGHVKGAFTGAEQNKMGLAEAAHGGDLFLDEVEALSLPQQAKLLRFLESGEVRRVGAKEVIHVETRVLAATNRSLNQLVKEGKFREDLLWRLSGKKIALPPLRERREDIPGLAHHFFAQDKFRKKEITEDAMAAFCRYDWPGNVRELKRVCEQLLLSAPLPVIRAEDVGRVIRPPATQGVMSAAFDLNQGLAALVNAFEREILQNALQSHNEIDDAARLLKISRSSLYKKIKDHGIQWRSET